MKIVIAGAGAVGTHLAKLLSREKHDIIVIDSNPDKLVDLSNSFDLLTKAVSPLSIEGLRSINVEKADLFIGVTPHETDNIIACMLARKMGARKTVARADSYEYIEKKNQELFKSIGIDSLILPEMIAAQEIASSVSRSWIRQWWEVENSDLVMMGIKVRENSHILNVPLKNLCGPESPYHIVAVKRADETIIPHGNDIIRSYDLVFFMTTRKYIPYIREIVGKENYPDVKNVAIMGGGMTSLFTAKLLPDYMHVKIIEKDEQRCRELFELIENKNVMIIHGDGRDMSLLQEENIPNDEAFIALTPNSETNILSCLAAKRMHIPKTVAMLDNLSYVSMAESLDIGTLINKQNIAAGYIYQMMLKADVTNVKTLMVANADVAEFNIKEGSKITSKAIKDLNLPKGATLGGFVRNGVGSLINGNTRLQAGDHVVTFCIGNDLSRLSTLF
ncbi:MAG: Trk system potassium transporter TrkA [Bacteroidaceae bacterium]|jgi:trk system potassium uptake protein TrkA|nr:Trk system potassium transporter TrkA [Bacteroidaceae bacterium]